MSERLAPITDLPFEVGALYNRRDDIHGPFGGQRQGGISTPADTPFIFLFTGAAGLRHGYHDFWDDDGVLHYYGEGQQGDMSFIAGNRAIRDHLANRKRLLLFQMMGHARPYRFLGEFRYEYAYLKSGIPDTHGNLREVIVFKLLPVEIEFSPFKSIKDVSTPTIELVDTTASRYIETRTKQSLFRRRLLYCEKQCRITGIADLRFLKASHIKPWSKCKTGDERTDGQNGLLLSPDADFLFDRGWITFENGGQLVRSSHLPGEVIQRIGLDLRQGRRCGAFFDRQKDYLEFHRNAIFEKAFKGKESDLSEFFDTAIP